MGYYESLAKMINDSGLTLKELSLKCEEYGVKVAPSYISKLQTKKQAPASDEVNTALARACNADIDSFLYDSYSEKAPDQIKKLHHDIAEWFKDYMKFLSEVNYPNEVSRLLVQMQNQMSNYDLFKHILSCSPNSLSNDESIADTIVFNMTMLDDSMEPKIPMGSDMEMFRTNSVEDGDIIAVLFSDEILVRRFVMIDKDKSVLLPDNYKYKSTVVNIADISIIGKIESIKVKM